MKYIGSICLIILCLQLSAQDDLPSGQVDVVKSFEARLAEAKRINVPAALPPLDTTTRRLNYDVVSKEVPVDYLAPRIRPLAFRTEKPPTVYDGFARLGGGLPSAFYGELSYDITKNDDFDFGVDLLRHTANNNSNVENQRFSNNKIGLDGTYYFEQGFAVNGEIGYQSNGIYYYGYNDLNEELDTTLYSFTDDEVRQRFSIFDFGLDIFNGERTQGDFNYKAGVDIYLMDDNYAARENGFLLTIEGTKWFADQHPLNISLRTDFSNFRDTAKQTLNNFYLEPNYTFHGDAFQVKIGGNLVSSEDNFFLFPNIEASANIVEGVLTAYIGADGSLTKNNFRNLAEYNPFIFTRFLVRNSKWTEYYGGVKGTIAGINYEAQLGYKNVDNLALFQLGNALDSIPRFDVLYDTANIFTIQGTVIVPLFEGLEITGSVAQNVFSLEREEKPWHLPSFTVNAGARYTTPDRQFSLKADFFLENGVPFRNTAGEAENLNALFDLSIMGEYYFTDNIGAWIQLNNLAANQRQRWFRYPTLGLNAMVGVSARF
ncbi:MAG: hypothetical protein AAFP77_00370 [Bacteroidota bacterium]